MNDKINKILESLKSNEDINESSRYVKFNEYREGMKYLNSSVDDSLEEIVDNVIDETDREDFLEEEVVSVVLFYIGDMISNIPFERNIIKDMESHLDDYID